MDEIIAALREVNIWSLLLRFVLAVLFGGLIGMEREHKHQPAGFRTHILVCLGAALVMATNQYMAAAFPGADPTRMGAQVISGIGFLGAGSIIMTRDRRVRGLTTAASLWASGCMGLALGCGFYEASIIAFVLILLVNTGFRNLGLRIKSHSIRREYFVELTNSQALGELVNMLRAAELQVENLELVKNESLPGAFAAVLTLSFGSERDHATALEIIKKTPGVVKANEI